MESAIRNRRVKMLVVGCLLTGGASFTLTSCGSNDVLSKSRVEATLAEGVSEDLGGVSGVTAVCPGDLEAVKGKKLTCTVTYRQGGPSWDEVFMFTEDGITSDGDFTYSNEPADSFGECAHKIADEARAQGVPPNADGAMITGYCGSAG